MNTTVGTLDIDGDDLLKALSMTSTPARTNEPGWFTVEELENRGDLGIGATTIRKRLHALIKSDAVEFKDVVRTSLLGTRYHCNAFKAKTR